MFAWRVPVGARRLLYQQSILPARSFEAPRRTLPFSQPHRSFHPSRPNRISVESAIDGCIEPGHQLLNILHTVGLPWMAAVPASALVIRAALIYITDIPNTKQALLLQSTFTPLRQARAIIKARQIHSNLNKFTDRLPDNSDVRRIIYNELDDDGKKLAKRWNMPTFWHSALLSVVQFPAFYVMVEAIRRMAGAPRGLLGWITETLRPMAGQVLDHHWHLKGQGAAYTWRLERYDELRDEGLPHADAQAWRDAEWQDYQDALKVEEEVAPSVQVVQEPIADLGPAAVEHHAWFDASFAEGGVLFFTDLAALDSHMILPTMVCGMMLVNIGAAQEGLAGWALFARRAAQLMSFGLWFLLINVPSGVLYYWFWSQTFKTVGKKMVEKIYKTGNIQAIDRKPCKGRLIRPFVKGEGIFDGK